MVDRAVRSGGPRQLWWLLAATAALLPAACRCQRSESGAVASAQGPAASQSAPAASVRIPDLAPGPPASPSPLVDDALWKEAQGGDIIDLERLATREGAAGLLQGVEVGGSVGLTGLLALPHADDAELALSRLCEILAHVVPTKAASVLRAVHGIIARPPPQAERLDLDGYRSCAPVLEEVSRNAAISPAERDLASSAYSLLGEHTGRGR
jgi:hypothetical protein